MIIAVDPTSLTEAGNHIVTLSRELEHNGKVQQTYGLHSSGIGESVRFSIAVGSLNSDISSAVADLAQALTAVGVSCVSSALLYSNVEGGVASAFSAAPVDGGGSGTSPDRPVASTTSGGDGPIPGMRDAIVEAYINPTPENRSALQDLRGETPVVRPG